MESVHLLKDLLIALKVELIRFRAMAAVIFSIVLLVGMAVAVNWPKYYMSSALITMDVTNVIQPLMKGAAEVAEVDKNINIEEIILSRRLLERVYAKFNPEYEQFDPKDVEQGISAIRDSLLVESVKGSRNSFRVSFFSDTPEHAYKILSTVVDVFIAETVDAKRRDSTSAHVFISEQVEKYKRRLEKADQRIKEFKARSIDATEAGVQSRIGDLKAEIQDLKLSISESKEKIQTTKSQLSTERASLTVRTKVNELEQRKAMLTDQLDQLRLVYQDSYPDIVTLKNQVDKIDAELYELTAGQSWGGGQNSELPLYEELRKQLSVAEVDLTTQTRRLSSLEDLLKNEYVRAEKVAENQAELADLMRDYEVTQNHYEEMLSRKESSNLTLDLNEEGQGASYKIIEPPYFPLEPAGFRALFIYLGALVAALGAPIGLVAVYIILDPRQRSFHMLQDWMPENVDVLANVPHRGTPLAERLLRKDMILLTGVGLILGVTYIYGIVRFQAIL